MWKDETQEGLRTTEREALKTMEQEAAEISSPESQPRPSPISSPAPPAEGEEADSVTVDFNDLVLMWDRNDHVPDAAQNEARSVQDRTVSRRHIAISGGSKTVPRRAAALV